MNHPHTAIRRRARKLFEADLPGDRAKIVADYRPALARSGNSDRGRAIYEKRCSICHRFGQSGHAVGPDLVSVQNKSPADLLIAILDPSREAQPNYVAYTVVTRQGTVYNGLIAAESAAGVTLRRAEGKEDRILRSQIDELVSTGKSLMPEGLGKGHLARSDGRPDRLHQIAAPGVSPLNKCEIHYSLGPLILRTFGRFRVVASRLHCRSASARERTSIGVLGRHAVRFLHCKLTERLLFGFGLQQVDQTSVNVFTKHVDFPGFRHFDGHRLASFYSLDLFYGEVHGLILAHVKCCVETGLNVAALRLVSAEKFRCLQAI